jgi:twitching motility protein PilT
VPAVEVLVASDAVRNLIRTSKTHMIYSTIATAKAAGMQTLEDSLAGLCKKRRITREDAVLRTRHPDELEALLR